MKIVTGRSQTLVFFFIALLMCFSLNSQAFAEWQCAQGSSGQLYDTSLHNTTVEPKLYYAWGIGYQQKPGATNWLVFPVPSIGLASIRYVVLNLNGVIGGDIYVDRVAVWSGDTKLVEDIEVNWTGTDIKWQVVDLGSYFTVSSLGIGLRTRTGDFGGMLKVFSVCVDFES